MIQNEINECISFLRKGKVILYPSDTIWGIGCDATNISAIKKIYKIKERDHNKSLITLVASQKDIFNLVDVVPESIYNLIKDNQRKPLTIIYNNVQLPKELIAKNGSAAIRICNDKFCKNLIKQFGKPIISTSANISGENYPKKFSDISKEIIENMDYIVNLRREEVMNQPSSIIKIEDSGSITKIR